jgi:osmotically inducible protein OsmC
MALALTLGQHHAIPDRLYVAATVTLEEVNGLPTIVSSALKVDGVVPDLSVDQFQDIVDEAARLCPVSRLFAGATITIETVLHTS